MFGCQSWRGQSIKKFILYSTPACGCCVFVKFCDYCFCFDCVVFICSI